MTLPFIIGAISIGIAVYQLADAGASKTIENAKKNLSENDSYNAVYWYLKEISLGTSKSIAGKISRVDYQKLDYGEYFDVYISKTAIIRVFPDKNKKQWDFIYLSYEPQKKDWVENKIQSAYKISSVTAQQRLLAYSENF